MEPMMSGKEPVQPERKGRVAARIEACRQWFGRLAPHAHREEVPTIWGLALVACFLGGLLTVGGVSLSVHERVLRETLIQSKRQALWKYASRSGVLFQRENHGIIDELNRFRSEQGLRYCALEYADGRSLARTNGSDVRADEVYAESDAGRLVQFELPVLDSSGKQIGQLRAGYAIPISPWHRKEAGLWLGCVILASLGLLLVLYRILRRSLRPMSKVRDRLLTYRDELESRLGELRIDDEKNLLITAWNQLVSGAEELQSELASVHSQSELADALRGHDDSQSREVIDWHPDGLLFVDEFGQVVLLNRASRSLARITDEQPVGKPVNQISANAELNQLLGKLTASSVRNRRATVYHNLVEDGMSTTLAITVIHVSSEKNPGAILLVLRDASQQKQAEKARDDFLHQVTHEFRTPLSNIRAYTETLMEGILEDRDAQRECLNVINAEAHRLGRLVEEVLTASQLEVGTARLRLDEVDLARLLQHAVQELQASADEKEIELCLELPPKVPRIQGDKDRLAVVLNNLLGNAIKYTGSGGNVTLVCEDRGRELEITVTDSGLGIAEEDLPHIFDKFYRSGSDAVQNLPGTGLGLATARQIVRLHGGEITIQSKPGEGSRFAMTLPVYELGSGTASRPCNETRPKTEDASQEQDRPRVALTETESTS